MSPIVIDRRLQSCTNAELQRISRRLFDLWDAKGRMAEDKMPKTWRHDVLQVRKELARRGVQLRIF